MRRNKRLIRAINILLIILFTTGEVQAQGDCSQPQPGAQHPHNGEILGYIQVSEPVLEATAANPAGAFRTKTINIDYLDPTNTRLLVSSSPKADLQWCIDDMFSMETLAGKVHVDFRSQDGLRIERRDPVDISHLFAAGTTQAKLTLTDLAAPNLSASPIYITLVTGPPPVRILPTVLPPTPIPTPQPTPTPFTVVVKPIITVVVLPTQVAKQENQLAVQVVTPEIAPTDTPTITPTPTSTAVPVNAINQPNTQVVPTAESSTTNLSMRSILWMGVFLLVLIGGSGWWYINHTPQLSGQAVIERDGAHYQTIQLSQYGREVTVGSEGEISLTTDDEEEIPSIVFRLRAERDNEGTVQINRYPELEDELEAVSVQIYHGYSEVIGSYSLRYENFLQEPTQETLEGSIWYET